MLSNVEFRTAEDTGDGMANIIRYCDTCVNREKTDGCSILEQSAEWDWRLIGEMRICGSSQNDKRVASNWDSGQGYLTSALMKEI